MGGLIKVRIAGLLTALLWACVTQAGVHDFSASAALPGLVTVRGAPVFANEIFGPGSEQTLVRSPVTNYRLSNSEIAHSQSATIKLTYDSGAHFGSSGTTIAQWLTGDRVLALVYDFRDSANPGNNLDGVTLIVNNGTGGGVTDDGRLAIEVDQGGAIGDNTVTFRLDTQLAADESVILRELLFGGVQLKNLTQALRRGASNPVVRLGAEFRNTTTTATDTQSALPILRSQNGVGLSGQVTRYIENLFLPILRARIDVADNERSFTGDIASGGGIGAAARRDFDSTDNVLNLNLGTARVVRTSYSDLLGSQQLVKKEDGEDFDFQGSDQIVITLGSIAALDAYAAFYLRPLFVADCSDSLLPGDIAGVVVGDGRSVQFDLSGANSSVLDTGYRLCLLAGGSQAIPESFFFANLTVDYFNPRYLRSLGSLVYRDLLRNGCQLSLFNVPAASAQDSAFIRLSNVSDIGGRVRAYLWTESGQRRDFDSVVIDHLPAHATAVLHTRPGLESGIFLGDVMPGFAALNSGRHRLVLQGAFPACEALGLMRSVDGTLINMTSTTFAGDAVRLGEDASNSSNTGN